MNLSKAALLLACSFLLPVTAPGTVLPIDLAYWQLPEWNTAARVIDGSMPDRKAIELTTKQPDWSQSILLTLIYPKEIARIDFRGGMKTQDVKAGVQDHEKARAQVSFLSAVGNRLGQWPGSTNRAGTSSWEPFAQDHFCPEGTRAVTVGLGMYLSSGLAAYENLELVAYDKAGAVVEPEPLKTAETTDTTGWWTFDPGTEDVSRPLVLDLSRFLDAPAGRHGFLRASGDHFTFADGKVARFWGAGSWSEFSVSRQKIVDYADRLARLGINMVRLHGMDAFDPNKSILAADGKLKENLLDTVDAYVFEMKKRGIYINMNLLTKRKYLTSDGVKGWETLPEGGKCASMFNRRLIDLQKDYARQLFTHKNPYTGLTYAEEPAIAYTEIVNENNLFDRGLWAATPTPYKEEIQQKFNDWCAAKKLSAPAKPFLELLDAWDPVLLEFFITTQRAYFQEIASYLKNDLQIKIPICGSNGSGGLTADVLVNADLDFVDRHGYWDHPSGGWSPTSQFRNQSIIGALSEANNPVYQLAVQRVEGKPFTVSEWNFVWSNEYITEGPLVMAAMGGFQDWSTLLQFNVVGKGWAGSMRGCWENDNKPHWIAASTAAALIFLRGDVAPGPLKTVYLDPRTPAALAGKVVSPPEVFTRRIAESLRATPAPDPENSNPSRELRLPDGELLVVDTPRTQAFVGTAKGKTIKTGDMTFSSGMNFAQVIVSASDDHPISQAKTLLITATARAENSNEQYHTFRRGLRTGGASPILLEPVRSRLIFAARGEENPKVYALDWYGRRTSQTLPVTALDGGSWSVELGGTPAYWFEVSFSPAPAP